MRSIHPDLKTAQETAANTPYVYVNINSTDYTSRLLSLEHIEEPYRDRATLMLENTDRSLDPGTTDLRGKSFSIGYGYNTTSGDRYSSAPILWVKSQYSISLEGRLVCILEAEGMWEKLRELQYLLRGDAPYYEYPFGGVSTIKTLIAEFLNEAGMSLNATWEDDGTMDSFKPFFKSFLPTFPSIQSLIHNTGGTGILQMTKSYLRPEASNVFKIIYPQTADSVNETYYSNQTPFFREYTEKRNLNRPNDIKVYWGMDSEGNWNATDLGNPGSAVDQDSIDAYTTVRRVFIAPTIVNQSDANDRASAILTRLRSETLAGRLILAYHDCSVELYDKVQIVDSRGI